MSWLFNGRRAYSELENVHFRNLKENLVYMTHVRPSKRLVVAMHVKEIQDM